MTTNTPIIDTALRLSRERGAPMTTPATSTRDELEDLLDQPRPESLQLAEGESFVGNYRRLERGETSYGPCWIVVLVDNNGQERALWLLHQALTNQFKRVRPQPGERVGVKNLGKRLGERSGLNYNDWRVVKSGDSASWDDVYPDPDDTTTPF